MPFTKQELTYIHLLAKGHTHKQIAEELHIKIITAYHHRESINMKLMGTRVTLDHLKNLSPELLEDWIKEHDKII